MLCDNARDYSYIMLECSYLIVLLSNELNSGVHISVHIETHLHNYLRDVIPFRLVMLDGLVDQGVLNRCLHELSPFVTQTSLDHYYIYFLIK